MDGKRKRSRSRSGTSNRASKKKTRRSLSSTEWPETMILFITTHGNIVCEQNITKKFILPPGMELQRIQISTPGEVNIATEDVVNGYASMINAHRDELLSKNTGTQKHAIDKMVKRIRYHDSVYAKAYKEIADEYDKDEDMDKEEAAEFRSDLQGYLEGQDRSHQIQTFKSTLSSPVVLINKLYTRTNAQATKNDWTIKVMNVPGQPDLLKHMKMQTRQGDSRIYLKEIVTECMSHGVKKMILFDFSCGSISDSKYEGKSKRETRALRRRIISQQV